jgi:hypothetical protein
MADLFWIERLIWEIEQAGETNDLSLPNIPDRNPKCWFSKRIMGEGNAQVQLRGHRNKGVKTYWSIKFLTDENATAWADETRGFGLYVPEINDLTIICPISDCTWVLEALRAHKSPVISGKLRQLSESSESWTVSSFRVLSDKRSLIREEAR